MDRRAYYPLGTWGNQRSKQSRPCPCCLRTIENIRAAWRQREDRKSKAAENEKLRNQPTETEDYVSGLS